MRIGATAVVLAAMVAYCAFALDVQTSLTHFLPPDVDRTFASLSRQLADSTATRTMILSIEAPEPAIAVSASRELQRALEPIPEIEWILGGLDNEMRAAAHELYFPRRHLFLSDTPRTDLPRRLSAQGLSNAAKRLKRLLASEVSPLVRRLAAQDPLLAYHDRLMAMLSAQEGGLTSWRDRFLTRDRRHAVLFLGSRPSAFDGPAQRRLLTAVDRAFARVNDQHGARLRLQTSGINRFAVASEQATRRDMVRISVASTLLLAILFLLVFRSPLYLLAGALPLASGVLCALTVTLAIWGSVHGLTLAFGATLIGVCIDYPVHFFNHHALNPSPAGPSASLRRVAPGLLLGGATTVLGMLALIWTTIPGIRELAVFASAGVTAAVLTTLLVLPSLIPAHPVTTALQRRLATGLARLLRQMATYRYILLVVPALALLATIVGLPMLAWQDDLNALNRVDPALQAEDREVRARASSMDVGRFILAVGKDDETALTRNDALFQRLKAARSAGEIAGFRSLHSYIWSAELQRRNWEAVAAQTELQQRWTLALKAEGFVASAFRELHANSSQPTPAPLQIEDLQRSPMAHLVRGFRVELGHGQEKMVAILTLLRDVRDAEALKRRLGGLSGVHYFDQPRLLERLYRDLRQRILVLIAVGLLAVFLLVLWRYRRLAAAVAAFVPAVLAATATLGILAAAGVTLNLLHVVTTLLVLSMGVDYGVFLVESTRGSSEAKRAHLAPTLLSLLIACLSTVFSFGMLGLSAVPALSAIGLTAGLGVLLSLLLAPTAIVLVGLARSS